MVFMAENRQKTAYLHFSDYSLNPFKIEAYSLFLGKFLVAPPA